MKPKHTLEQVAKKLRYECQTGLIYWTTRPCPNVFPGDVAGTKKSNGYLQICIDGQLYKAHRLAWLLHYGEWPKENIDHINGDRSDNRISNLRDVDQFINMQNQRKGSSRNKSGLLGVSPWKGRWKAEIFVSGKKKYLGLFDTANEAHAAYLNEKRGAHAGCTL